MKGLVLDLSDGVVNLSIKPELISSARNVGLKKVMVVPLVQSYQSYTLPGMHCAQVRY